ncbi:MAG: 50S ribosomal protein L28 [Candidatus Dasytiphilus stammeri]
MSKLCQVTGKRPIVGNNRSHSMNASKRRFVPNLHFHKFWIEEENRFVKLRLTRKGIRTIDKKGIKKILIDIKNNKN